MTPEPGHGAPTDVDDVASANAAFYRAFETGDMAAMDACWEHSDRVVCTHPGSPALRGWNDVRRSWSLLLSSPVRPEFIVTEERIDVIGDVAWVTLVENMIVTGGSAAGTAVNWFVRNGPGWSMVGHHGAPISRGTIL